MFDSTGSSSFVAIVSPGCFQNEVFVTALFLVTTYSKQLTFLCEKFYGDMPSESELPAFLQCNKSIVDTHTVIFEKNDQRERWPKLEENLKIQLPEINYSHLYKAAPTLSLTQRGMCGVEDNC